MSLTTSEKEACLELALEAIRTQLGIVDSNRTKLDVSSPALNKQAACFVTLTIEQRLRGCIGSLEAHRSLHDDIWENAIAAGFRDPRFPPLVITEFEQLQIEISVLSPHSPIAFDTEDELLRQLCPGVDGLVISQGPSRATFLPSVWKSLTTPEEFLRHLKAKAGISSAEHLRAWRYHTESFACAASR